MPSNKRLLQAAAGNAGESLYVEDVFSTYLYEGTGSTRSIVNGIDLSGEGGLTWIKARDAAYSHQLFDTERGATKQLYTNITSAETTDATSLTAFNSDGFSLGSRTGINGSGTDFVSWSFRKAEKFFDVVTWTGDGTSNRQIAHNLGTTPACIIVKRLNNTANWAVWHQGFNSGSTTGGGFLNLTQAFGTEALFSNNGSAFSDSYFLVSNSANRETNGFLDTYVAYVFASDAGGFGDDDENIIKCGSFTEPSSGSVSINLGFEPQFVLAKPSSTAGDWYLFDVMRGMPVSPATARLSANSSAAEVVATSASGPWPLPTATGFDWKSGFVGNETWIYIAIRRPMKTPESGTEVFTPALASSSGDYTAVAGFPVDMNIYSQRSSANNHFTYDRLRGGSYLATDDTSAETGDFADWDSMTDFYIGGVSGNYSDYINWMFKRATGFFDVVAYTGDGTNKVIPHNLGVKPELIITKPRSNPVSSTTDWIVYAEPLTNSNFLYLNTNSAAVGAALYPSEPTTDNYTVLGGARIGDNGGTNISYLFATLAGVSKVGSYTGTNTTNNIDCGFSSSARFILIKRTDSTDDWYVWDSARGITVGNDPYLTLNTTAAELYPGSDVIQPYSSGFTLTNNAGSGINGNGGSYIFLAIA